MGGTETWHSASIYSLDPIRFCLYAPEIEETYLNALSFVCMELTVALIAHNIGQLINSAEGNRVCLHANLKPQQTEGLCTFSGSLHAFDGLCFVIDFHN